MTTPPETPPAAEQSLSSQWQAEQQNWQQLLQSFADAAAQDETFLVHIGNAMRGSLLAGKPYPGTTAEPAAKPDSTMAGDELVFAVRRLEGQVSELISVIDGLSARIGSAGERTDPA